VTETEKAGGEMIFKLLYKGYTLNAGNFGQG
jgi:hypothetical protein